MVFLTFYPFLVLTLITSNSHRLSAMAPWIGDLYRETRYDSLWPRMHAPLFLFRRLLYVLILVVLKDYPLV